MTDTVLRHVTMLSLIPQGPRKIAVQELHEKLAARGLNIHVRSVERDLVKLSSVFPLLSDAGKPTGWWWDPKAPALSLPGMDPGTALTYQLIARYLEPLLPRALLKQLESAFAASHRVLDEIEPSPLSRWSKRIAAVVPGFQLIPPAIPRAVSDVVYQALLDGRRFEVTYRGRFDDAPKRYPVNPLGLVFRAGVLYLVATVYDYDDPRHFALHRMTQPTLLDIPAHEPRGFDFERYIREEHAFDYPTGAVIQVELRVAPDLVRHLQESRIALDQTITPLRGSEDQRLTASVHDTEQFRWWLRSLGASIEVIKPIALRKEMARVARAAARRYQRR